MKNFALMISIIILTSLITGCFNPNNDYISIQEKIDNSNNGDIIFIKSGNYNEKIIINKSISLIGENKNNTIINYGNYNNSKNLNIILINANNCTIKNFSITTSNILNNTIGININSSYNIITNNSIFKTKQAIYLNYESFQNHINNNIILENQNGIKLAYSHNNNISKNDIYLNSNNGINSDTHSINNIIYLNNISYNKYGIQFSEGILNKIIKNYIFCNLRGIYLCCGANNNTIYNNYFIKNSDNNARCTTYNNWYSKSKSVGNYWDDYIGNDDNNDGLGDIPYHIPGEKSIDPYPLINYIY